MFLIAQFHLHRQLKDTQHCHTHLDSCNVKCSTDSFRATSRWVSLRLTLNRQIEGSKTPLSILCHAIRGRLLVYSILFIPRENTLSFGRLAPKRHISLYIHSKTLSRLHLSLFKNKIQTNKLCMSPLKDV